MKPNEVTAFEETPYAALSRSRLHSGQAGAVQTGTENDSNIRLSSCQLIKTPAGHSFVNI